MEICKCVTNSKSISFFNKLEQELNRVHGDFYNYDKLVFNGRKKRVEIICPMHGVFEQVLNNHLQGQGCPVCGETNRRKNATKNTETFIAEAKQTHGDTYDYSKTVYKKAKDKVEIVCKIHGVFEQYPQNHINGFGCDKCGIEKKRLKRTTLLRRFNEIHNSKYMYDINNYEGTSSIVKIFCLKHGWYSQTVREHLAGCGCRKCANESLSYNMYRLYCNDKVKGAQPGIFYKVIFTHKNSGVKFLKVGVTSKTIKQRYHGYKDFTYEIITEIHTTNKRSVMMEKEFKDKTDLKKFIFNGIKFIGYTECYCVQN